MKFECEPEKLQKIINHAYETTPFYMQLTKEKGISLDNIEAWEQLPLINKTDLVINSDSFLSSAYLPLYIQKKLLRVHTSGSTGKCAVVYWKDSENKCSLMPLWLKRKRDYQINPHDRHCYFFTGRKIGSDDLEIEDIGYAMGFCKSNLNDKKLIEVWNIMCEFDPIWLILQPSMASLLCKAVEEHNLQRIPNLRYIETTGEMLTSSTRERIERVLHVKMANQYGCNEMNSIAYECPEGNLHCMEGNVFVEILNENGEKVPDGEEGEICLTSLTNYAMPLIRYLVGTGEDLFIVHVSAVRQRKYWS